MNQEFIDLYRQLEKLQRTVDNAIKPEVSGWADWTPTITQSVAVAATVQYARYTIINKTAITEARLLVTGAGVAGNNIEIGGQPTLIQHGNTNSNNSIIGAILVFDSGTAFYHGALVSSAATTWLGFAHNQTGAIGTTPSFALANGDRVTFVASYERA